MKNAWKFYSLGTKDYYTFYIDKFKFRSKSMYLQNGALSPISLGVLNSADLFAKGTGKFLLNWSIIDPFPLPDIEQTEERHFFCSSRRFSFHN